MGTNTTYSTVNQTTGLPAYAQPYYMGLMNSAQAVTDITKPPPVYGQTATLGADGKYTYAAAPAPYDWATSGQRIAGFTPQQQQVQQNILGQQMPGQFQQGANLASQAGLGALNAGQYTAGQFNAQMQQPRDVQAQRVQAQNMQAAQTDYNPNLNYYQMQGPGSFGSTQAQQFMSPYMQSVVDVQKQQAIRDAQQGQLSANLGAVRQGTYGGARQLLAGTERERNLGTQLGSIQAQGQQQAFQNAQQQFNAEQALQQQAGQQNLLANLGVQNLGTETGLRTALANLTNEQQARVNNQALDFQSQGMNAENALRAALANQQMSFNVGQQNLNATLANQAAGEQSRQFGAKQGLAALAQANESAQTLGNLGSAQQQAQLAMYGQQQGVAAQEQALKQQYLDTSYQDYLRQLNYPEEQLKLYSNLLQGLPVAADRTQTSSAPGPSVGSQIMGTGLTALSAYNMAKP